MLIKRTRTLIIAGLVVMLLAISLVQGIAHAESRGDDEVIVAVGEVVDDDLYAAADRVIIDGTVKGDLIVFAREVYVNGTVEGDLISFAQAVAVRGVVQDDARVAAQAFVVKRGGRIGDDINAAGYGITVEAGSNVGGNVWVAASQLVLAGQIAGDLAGGGESVQIAGNIGGNVEIAVADGEARPGFSLARFLPALPEGFQLPEVPYGLSVTPDARIAGRFAYATRIPITLPEGVVRGEVIHRPPETPVEEETKKTTEFGSLGWAVEQVQRLLRLLLVGLLVVWLANRWLRRASTALRARPFSSFGWGVLSPFALLIFVIVASLIILGVAVLLSYALGSTALLTLLLSVATGTVVVVYLMLLFYVGGLVTAYALGERILRARTIRPIWVMLLGIAIFWVLTLIPVVGIFIGIVFALFGLGAIWLAIRRVEGTEVQPSPASS